MFISNCSYDQGSTKKIRDTKDAESILINVAGRLLLFQREQSSEVSPHKNWVCLFVYSLTIFHIIYTNNNIFYTDIKIFDSIKSNF